MKRVILPILCLLLLLTASGCGSILEGEVTVIEPYTARYDDKPDESEDTVILHSDEEFAQAVQKMLTQEQTDAVFRIPLPDDVAAREEELMDVCRSVALDTPLGAYAVYYISCRLTPIVSYCNLQVSVTYKREAEAISGLFTVSSLRYMDSRLQTCLSSFSDSLVFRTSLDEITADYLADRISYLFRRSPLEIVAEPGLEVVCYPNTTGERIMELKLDWPYNASVLDDMRGRMISRTDDISGRTGNTDDYSVIQTLIAEQNSGADILEEAVSFLSDSAYGFLVNRSGTQRSAALSLKALCDRLNIGCYVVEGWHNGETAWWNIVSCDGKWYHADPAGVRVSPEDGSLLLSDDAMTADQYFWDVDDYPPCPEGYPLPLEEPVIPAAAESTPAEGGETQEPPPPEDAGEPAAADTEPQPEDVPADVPENTEDETPPEDAPAEDGAENEAGQEPSGESEQEDTP